MTVLRRLAYAVAEPMTSPASPALRLDPRDEELFQGVFIVDVRGTVLYSSTYASQLFGVGGMATSPSPGNTLEFFHPDEQTPFPMEQLPIRRALQGEEVKDVDIFIRNQNMPQGLHVRCRGAPLRDEKGLIIGGMSLVRGLDQAQEIERRIAARTAQLEQANRELEDFSYSVAHDLRAPLRAISSFCDALVEDCAGQLDAMGQDYVKRIRGGTQRMSSLIDGILTLSRVNRATFASSQCDISAMARTACEKLKAQHPERTVRLTVQEGLADQGDPQLLRTVLENLLDNAWKFTRGRPVAEIEFGATQEEGGRTYFVKDNGAGFEMAYKHKLFGVFQRLHARTEFEGSGIGLAAAQRAIRRHGGRIWGEGQPGQGACFFFTLHEQPVTSASTVPPGASHD
jgi:signal transduction histidine kinase